MKDKVTVAAAQFHVGDDVAANLRNCLRMIHAAGEHDPQLLVLPEFSNHCSWYTGPEHCREVSVELGGDFLAAVAQAVRRIDSWTVINCSLRRRDRVTGSSILFSPAGYITAVTDKQVLIGHENDFLTRASSNGPLADTPFGRIGMYACMDGVISETPRCLALRGARILCNSLNSMAFDEGDLHIPVRAAENRVWVVAANKVGPLIPEFALAAASEAIHIPARFLAGAGDSQIVAPDGAVLARAGKDEQVVSAEIDTTRAADKLRKDGTDIFASRRPSLYARLAQDPNTAGSASGVSGPERLQAAMVSLASEGDAALDEACGRIREARSRGAALICLPALPGSCGLDGPERSKGIVARIAAAAGENCLVATSLALSRAEAGSREEASDASPTLTWAHVAVLVDGGGVIFEQPLVHCQRALRGVGHREWLRDRRYRLRQTGGGVRRRRRLSGDFTLAGAGRRHHGTGSGGFPRSLGGGNRPGGARRGKSRQYRRRQPPRQRRRRTDLFATKGFHDHEALAGPKLRRTAYRA